MAKQLESWEKMVVPGWGICRTCEKHYQDLAENDEDETEEDSSSQEDAEIADFEQSIEFETEEEAEVGPVT